MTTEDKRPGGDNAPTGASYYDSHNHYSTAEAILSRGLGMPTPDGTNPANASITRLVERWWDGNPLRSTLKRGIRLNAPERCSVDWCDEPAYCTQYLLKYYRSKGETYSSGVDRNCPFLCSEHYLDDKSAFERGEPTPYTDVQGWATRIIYRRVLPPMGRFDKEAA